MGWIFCAMSAIALLYAALVFPYLSLREDSPPSSSAIILEAPKDEEISVLPQRLNLYLISGLFFGIALFCWIYAARHKSKT
jgi:hypothetical protein